MKQTTFLLPITFEKNVAKAGESDGSNMSFIFTDTEPNGNNQGVRADEFPNLVKTGSFKPVKIGESGGHFDAFPVGVITKMEITGQQILGAASLWDAEFPELIDEMKLAASNGSTLQTSWEILYEDSEVDDDGTEWLTGCNTKAIAIVDSPAYAGRTPVLALAQKYLQDKNIMDDKELKDLLSKASHLEVEVESLVKEKAVMQETLDEAKATLEELVGLKDELETLRMFKVTTEEELALRTLRTARLAKFEEAGIEMPEEEFKANAESWLALDDAAFAFVLQTLTAKQATKESKEGTSTLVPFLNSGDEDSTPEQILRAGLFKKSEEK